MINKKVAMEKIIVKALALKEAYIALDRFSWNKEELRTI